MKYHILSLFLIFTLLLLGKAIQAEINNDQQEQGQPTTQITFYVQQDQEQDKDFIELILEIKNQDSSLITALSNAGKKVQKVVDTCTKFCQNDNDTDDSKCQEMVDIGNYQIKPKYQIIRKKPTFVQFVVTHQITIKVQNTQQIGQLVDKLLACGIQQITQIQWQPNQEKDAAQSAFIEGLSLGKKLCRNAGKKFNRVISVQQVIQQQGQEAVDGQQQGGNQGQQQQQEESPSEYTFVVQCIPKEVQ